MAPARRSSPAPAAPSPRALPPSRWIAAAVAVLACAVYANSVAGPLLYDDVNAIVRNTWVHAGSPLAILTHASWWAEGHGHGWRPATTLTFAANYALHGLAPFGYHLVNVVLHAAVSVSIATVLTAAGVAPAVATLTAVLFAVHPVHTEAVASVVGRAELLAALAFLVAWRLFVAATERRRHGAAARRIAAWPLDVSGGVVLFLGLLAKENALALVPVLAVADVLYDRDAPPVPSTASHSLATWLPRWPLVRITSLVGAVVAYAVCRRVVLGSEGGSIDVLDNPLVALALPARVMTACKVVALYAWRLLFPLRLSADYSFDQITAVRSATDPSFLAGLAIVVALPAIAWWTRRRAPEVALGAVVMICAFAPVSNLLFSIGTIMAERLLYLPSLGFCMMLAGTVVRLAAATASGAREAAVLRRAALAIGVIASLYALRTWTRNVVWTEPLRFFTTTVADAPRSARSHRELGAVLADAGRFDDASREFERSLAIKPGDAATLYNLANALMQAGRYDDAAGTYHAALEANPAFASAMVNLGNVESMRGNQQEALVWLRKAVDLTPPSGLASLRMNIANTLFRAGARDEARGEYRAALALAPDDPEILLNYGAFLYAGSEFNEASEMYGRASVRRPTVRALVGLAGSYYAAGKRAEARSAVAKAAALFPNDASVRQMSQVVQHDDRGGEGS